MYSKSEAKELMTQFWEDFAKYSNWFAVKKRKPISWMLYKTGIKGLELKFELESKFVRCILEVNARNDERRLNIYVELDEYKPILEKGFKKGLIWLDNMRLDTGKPVMRIYCELTGVTFHNRDNWPEIFTFMAENMWRLQNNFEEILPVLEEKFKFAE